MDSPPLSIRAWCIILDNNQDITNIEVACVNKEVPISSLYAYRVDSNTCTIKENQLVVLYVTFRNKQTSGSLKDFCRMFNLQYKDSHPKQHPMFADADSKYFFKRCLKYFVRSGEATLKKSVVPVPVDEGNSNVQVSSETTEESDDTGDDGSNTAESRDKVVVGDNRMSFDMSLSPRPIV